MKIAVDTNVLVRIALQDTPNQVAVATDLFRKASLIVIPLPCLCEMVWVLKQGFMAVYF